MATQTGSIDLRGVKQSYESVEVGGRNLFSNFAFNTNVAITDIGNYKSEGFTYYALWASSIISTSWIRTNLMPSTAYTISFDYEILSIESGITDARSQGIISSASLGGLSVSISASNRTEGYKAHYEVTWTTPSDMSSARMYWYTFYSNANSRACNDTIRISNLKLEKGTKATAWTPAPEDVQEDIDMAQDTASTANSTASNALNDAAAANELAGTAQQNALEAKGNIEDLEAIIGASNWVTGHGIYNKSTDTTVNIAKEYYTVSATAVSNPTGSPHKGLYYELSNGTYILTSDDAVVSGKTYYTLSANLVDEPTGNPSTSGYYERNLNESIEDYLSTHIKMNSNGLFVTDGSASQVQVSSTGVSIWNGEKQLANYGATARIGAEDEFHIQIGGSDNEIGFYQGANNKVAYINGQALYVTNSLSFGEDSDNNAFIFYQRANGHFTLKLSKKVVS